MAEVYVSVDVETSGPIPPAYSMLALGACLVNAPEVTFYAELRPIGPRAVPEAMEVIGRPLEDFAASGRDPQEVMVAFRDWLTVAAGDGEIVFVGFNATFDWAFVNWYFHTYVGDNPFGIGGIDIKSFYMGQTNARWEDTRSSRLPSELQEHDALEHHALADAARQGRLFRKLRWTRPGGQAGERRDSR